MAVGALGTESLPASRRDSWAVSSIRKSQPRTDFRPIPVRDALNDWAAEPFWVDIVKVGRMPDGRAYTRVGLLGQRPGENVSWLTILDGRAEPLPSAALVKTRRMLGEHPQTLHAVPRGKPLKRRE